MDVLVVTVVHHPLDARITGRQARALVDAGHRVRLAGPWSAYDATPPTGIEAIDLPRAHGRSRLAAVRRARRLLAAHGGDVDAIVVHDPELVPAAVSAFPDRTVWDVHEDTATALADKPWLPRASRPAVRRAMAGLERAAERRLWLILAEDAYTTRFARPHPVVPNLPWVPDTVVPPDDRRVVYLGRISAGRGADQLLALARALPDDVDLELIGPADADIAPHLQAAHDAGQLTWSGFVPNHEALARVDGAAVGVSLLADTPNYRQSLPTKVVEYLARGVPVVTTANPQAAGIVRGARAGLVVAHDDSAATTRAVRWLLDHHHERRQLAAAGHAAARDRYDWRRHAARFVELIEDVPRGGGPVRPR